MRIESTLAALAILSVPGSLVAQHPVSPYAGEEDRAIKALAPEQVEAYLSGDGSGLAKAAELNGYPGPRHVLDLAAELGLTAAQVDTVQRIFNGMRAAAVALGRELVDAEAELDGRLAERRIDPDRLSATVSAIAELGGELRYVHLRAHLDTRAVLSRQQSARYMSLRGYGRPAHGHGCAPHPEEH